MAKRTHPRKEKCWTDVKYKLPGKAEIEKLKLSGKKKLK